MFYDEESNKSGSSSKRHFNGIPLAGPINSPTLNAGLVALRFSRGSGHVLLKGGGSTDSFILKTFKVPEGGSNIFRGGGALNTFIR